MSSRSHGEWVREFRGASRVRVVPRKIHEERFLLYHVVNAGDFLVCEGSWSECAAFLAGLPVSSLSCGSYRVAYESAEEVTVKFRAWLDVMYPEEEW
jgi:hypothetical protein